MIQHHINKDGESYLPHSFGGMLYPVPLSTMLKKRFRDVSIIKGLPMYSMIPVGYGKPVTDGVHVKIPPPPPPPMTEFEKSLAWMKEFIDDVEDDAWEKWGDGPWLGAWCNPTKEDFLKHLAVVSKGESSPDVG